MENMWLADVDATNNWWGTTNASLIKQTIYHDDNYSGSVFFTPFLTAPNPYAPAIPTSQLPPATQTPAHEGSPTTIFGLDWLQIAVLAVVGLIAMVVLAAAIMHKRKRP